ncbi:hypothetical protein DWF00_16650 [Bosea caraganae]|uniref:Uncharacterized protein n=1 Tax=Bosea caraganae TaxID=2763117 RepID=A0A370KYP9_9HYPH|nr:hypothetical protein DWE98_26255 [Bosea caraganae]RDJ24851.1 hypothetical protein DWF00_16650 [Bosea caraganae]
MALGDADGLGWPRAGAVVTDDELFLPSVSAGMPEPGRGRLSLDRGGWPTGGALLLLVISQLLWRLTVATIAGSGVTIARQTHRVGAHQATVIWLGLRSGVLTRCVRLRRLLGPHALNLGFLLG